MPNSPPDQTNDRGAPQKGALPQDGEEPVEVIGTQDARQGTSNHMNARVLLISLPLVSAAFVASYFFFGR